ncbi:hypothetical protein PAHA111176_17610 [Parendozoicomonas haliclonae]|uniref:Uncharacterized protein n=1 Tax=Parendozoicomonas haliclonae TaxID=1960125 RepID=A0A1X7AP37_9GAMM|nr:hypothetical protein EHSB41UT_03659 [Parendozoicomonas haliclonae]
MTLRLRPVPYLILSLKMLMVVKGQGFNVGSKVLVEKGSIAQEVPDIPVYRKQV